MRVHPHRPSSLRRLATRLLTATSLSLATSIGAQQPALGTITGRVTSADDGSAITGATIAVTGTQYGAITRGDGTYRLQLRPGTYELRARLIGYTSPRDTVVVTAGGTLTRDFRLSHAASTLEAVAIIGSRAEARTVIESPVPVDVLSAADIKSTGRTETAQILQQLAPSVNFPRATISDGTDHVRPATLRGLGADQTLVLINGKRRHTSALVNVNGSIGRGQAAVDLNAIPASMIDHIEVLRDGAAAQYGSDAIAGVINIVLKSKAPAELTSTIGRANTTYGGETVGGAVTPSFKATDGRVVQVATTGGLTQSSGGYLYGGAEYRDRGNTNRTFGDPRPQTFAEQTAGVFRDNATGQRFYQQGDAATTDVVGFVNGAKSLDNGVELYAFGGAGHRSGKAAGNWRRALQAQTIRTIYPNGFLPFIGSTIWDGSGFAGARGRAKGWQWDLSSGYGHDSFRFDVTNSNNASLGTASPTEFYAGTLGYGQWTNNLDVSRQVKVGSAGIPLRLAAGAEFRLDQYKITAGEPASYIDGGVRVLDANGNPTATPGAPGAQVFPGFQPKDAVDKSRNNVGLYADVEADLTKQFLVGGAVRFENYSDFGSATSGKVASRLTIRPGFVLRGAVNTGFRAPSLQQSYYSATATNFVTINGVNTPVEIKTLPVASDAAKLLGSRPLRPEKSVNLSGGVALEPLRSLALTVDVYHIAINDRVVLSENFVGTQVAALLQPLGIGGARYFTNAIDTRTNGVDVVANYGINLTSAGFLRLTSGYNHNRTKATIVAQTPAQLGDQNEALFGRVERGRVEEGQPRDNFLASADYTFRKLGAVVRTQRFGEVTARLAPSPTNLPLEQTFRAKWITDVSASYKLVSRLTLTVGADNVLDVYPDQNNNLGNVRTGLTGNSNTGIFPYSQLSPFGFNGRFVYTRLSVGL
jgi:iron complex outermembrane receptor protein